MRTWLKWIGDKHQNFKDWSEAENIPAWKSIIRNIIFCIADGLLMAAGIISLILLIFMLFGKLFIKDNSVLEE